MTASQIAASIVALNTFQHGGDRKSEGIKGQRCLLKTQQETADADAGGVRTLKSAAKDAKDAPELVPAMRDGKLDAHTASKVADLPKLTRVRPHAGSSASRVSDDGSVAKSDLLAQ